MTIETVLLLSNFNSNHGKLRLHNLKLQRAIVQPTLVRSPIQRER